MDCLLDGLSANQPGISICTGGTGAQVRVDDDDVVKLTFAGFLTERRSRDSNPSSGHGWCVGGSRKLEELPRSGGKIKVERLGIFGFYIIILP